MHFIPFSQEHVFQQFEIGGIIIHHHDVAAMRRRLLCHGRQASSNSRVRSSYRYLSASSWRACADPPSSVSLTLRISWSSVLLLPLRVALRSSSTSPRGSLPSVAPLRAASPDRV